MPSAPRISVVIDTFEQAAFVAEAVESVLEQRRPADEIVVVDDGSSDDTPAVLARYADRVRVVRQENRGQAGALNRGLAETQGDWVAFLDGDDRWGEGHLEAVERAINSAHGVDAVCARMLLVNAEQGRIVIDPPDEVAARTRTQSADREAGANGLLEWFPPTSGLALRRALLRPGLPSAGPIPERFRIAADGWLQVAIAISAHRVVYLESPTAELRVHGANRWTGQSDYDVAVVARRRALYADLASEAQSLGQQFRRDVSGLVRALEAQRDEFHVLEHSLSGRRAEALRLARRWEPSPAVQGAGARFVRRAAVLQSALLPARAQSALRSLWRSVAGQ